MAVQNEKNSTADLLNEQRANEQSKRGSGFFSLGFFPPAPSQTMESPTNLQKQATTDTEVADLIVSCGIK